MGWTYEELLALPIDVYSELVDALNEDAAKTRK
jgi:hypothetical protein